MSHSSAFSASQSRHKNTSRCWIMMEKSMSAQLKVKRLMTTAGKPRKWTFFCGERGICGSVCGRSSWQKRRGRATICVRSEAVSVGNSFRFPNWIESEENKKVSQMETWIKTNSIRSNHENLALLCDEFVCIVERVLCKCTSKKPQKGFIDFSIELARKHLFTWDFMSLTAEQVQRRLTTFRLSTQTGTKFYFRLIILSARWRQLQGCESLRTRKFINEIKNRFPSRLQELFRFSLGDEGAQKIHVYDH